MLGLGKAETQMWMWLVLAFSGAYSLVEEGDILVTTEGKNELREVQERESWAWRALLTILDHTVAFHMALPFDMLIHLVCVSSTTSLPFP